MHIDYLRIQQGKKSAIALVSHPGDFYCLIAQINECFSARVMNSSHQPSASDAERIFDLCWDVVPEKESQSPKVHLCWSKRFILTSIDDNLNRSHVAEKVVVSVDEKSFYLLEHNRMSVLTFQFIPHPPAGKRY